MIMYEIAADVGYGASGYFFLIKDHPRLGVKIREDNSKRKLKQELVKGKILQKMGVPVPKHVGIIVIEIPEDYELSNKIKNQEIREKILSLRGKVRWGLVLEFIEKDVEMISRIVKKRVYNQEREKVEMMKIIVKDSDPVKNVLWCQRRKKMFFIDIEKWKIPWRYYFKLKL
jgi:hypothetical protein